MYVVSISHIKEQFEKHTRLLERDLCADCEVLRELLADILREQQFVAEAQR